MPRGDPHGLAGALGHGLATLVSAPACRADLAACPGGLAFYPTPGALGLAWDLATLEAAAIERADRAVAAAERSWFALLIVCDRWTYRETVGRQAARERLGEAAAMLGPALPVALPYRATPRATGQVVSPGLIALRDAWHAAGGALSGDFLEAADRAGYLQKSLFYVEDPRDGTLRYRLVGLDFARWLGPDWPARAPGQPLGFDDPDAAYVAWCEQAYRTALAGREPLLAFCDIMSGYRAFDGIGRRVHYERIILPMTLADGEPGLFMASETESARGALAP